MVDFDIIRSIDLVDYIETNYPEIQLIKIGNVYKGLCPFHNEKTPSFTIFTNSNRFKCFGCGVHGSIIDFVMMRESLEIKEAVMLIGENANIEVQFEKPNPYFEEYKDNMTSNANRYHNFLLNDNEVMNYLQYRGLTLDIIKKFNIGLVPQDEYKIRNDIGNISGRISFPIYEHKNPEKAKVLGMGYRLVTKETKGISEKYINDRNQVGDTKRGQDERLKGVFIKGNCLYGLQLAYKDIRQKNFVIACEGYMDTIGMYQSGITNAVSIMSTAFTNSQMDILRKLTANIMLILDGDKAGTDNMIRIIPPLYEKGFNVMLTVIDSGKDPMDLCKDLDFNGRKIMCYINEESISGCQYLVDKEISRYEKFVTKQRIKILNDTEKLFDSIKDKKVKAVYKNMLLKKIDMK